MSEGRSAGRGRRAGRDAARDEPPSSFGCGIALFFLLACFVNGLFGYVIGRLH